MQDSEPKTPTGNAPAGGEAWTLEQAIAALNDAEPNRRYYAAWWLGRFRVDDPRAIAALIDALDDESDRTEDGGYPLRRNAARALGKLGDRRAVEPLIKSLDCSDFYVREAAAQALEALGDRGCVPALQKLLAGGMEDTEAIPGKPHLLEPYDAVIEAIGMLGATEAIPDIEPFTHHPFPRIQYAARRAMYQLTGEAVYGDRLIEALRGDDLPLRRCALMDLGAIGYLRAAEPIRATLAENSLKLIALQGLLEHHLRQTDETSLSEEAVHLMDLMDSLL
jgi:phycocyanobilin lyase alpha subunit